MEVPRWAKDPLNGNAYATCPKCGAFHEVVRPGKTQPTCNCGRPSPSEWR